MILKLTRGIGGCDPYKNDTLEEINGKCLISDVYWLESVAHLASLILGFN